MYILKLIHVTTALISIIGFILRGIWMMQGSEMLKRKWVKITPHVNDTVLLLTAVSLAVMASYSPLTQPWLAAKIVGLFVYIGLGLNAFRFGKTRQVKIISWIAAMIVFAYIVLVAVTKSVAII